MERIKKQKLKQEPVNNRKESQIYACWCSDSYTQNPKYVNCDELSFKVLWHRLCRIHFLAAGCADLERSALTGSVMTESMLEAFVQKDYVTRTSFVWISITHTPSESGDFWD